MKLILVLTTDCTEYGRASQGMTLSCTNASCAQLTLRPSMSTKRVLWALISFVLKVARQAVILETFHSGSSSPQISFASLFATYKPWHSVSEAAESMVQRATLRRSWRDWCSFVHSFPSSILVPACADVCKKYISPLTGKPVLLVAGGGVSDGRSLASALVLGASAVWVGTRFVAARESGAPEAAKAR